MKIAHFSDLHYCPDHLVEVDRCFSHAIEQAIQHNCEAAVISGDLFDRRVEVHQLAVSRLLAAVSALANHMPVLILQGTFSHDQPGSLDIFRTIAGRHPVHVADTVKQVMFSKFNGWMSSPGYAFKDVDGIPEPTCLFSCLPPVNKGAVAAAAGTQDAATAAGEYVYDLMKGWSVTNAQAAAAGIPTVVVSHGTVNGCITEHGVPMHGNDHEFTTGTLFASKASAIMLGHIHQMQTWPSPDGNQLIGYPGSVGRLHFGEVTDKGFLIWEVAADCATATFHTTPAKRLLQIEFDGPPDMDALLSESLACDGAHVRIRWTVDEEHRHGIDKAAIEALFSAADAVKLEGRIRPVQRQRAAGISQAHSLTDKLANWCTVSDSPGEPLHDRLAMLESMEPEVIAASIVDGKINKQEDVAA